MEEDALVLVHTPHVDVVGALLRDLTRQGGSDAVPRIVAYDDVAELVAAARKADAWLCVLDLRETKGLSDGVVRRLRMISSQPEVLVRGARPGDGRPQDLPDDSFLDATATDARLVEQALRLLALQRVRRASGIVGTSTRVRELLATIAQVAPLDVPVLVHGESGTGKEMVARALHDRSRRARRPFVSINVGSLAESLLESELFGHEKGAFTGAVAQRAGVFERADGGTLFLDELGEMSPGMQVKLLRVLETSEFQRVGGNETLRTDVRIVAATHRDLETEMEAGRFRSDLYYRLKVVRIEIPPLRERPDDILVLAQHFLDDVNRRHGLQKRGFTTSAMQRLREHAWPGNVRELRNVVSSMAVMAPEDFLDASDLPPEMVRSSGDPRRLPVRTDVARAEAGGDGIWTNTLLALVADVRRIAERIDDIAERLDQIESGTGRVDGIGTRGVEAGSWDQGALDADFVPLSPEAGTDMASAEKALIEATLRQFDGNRRRTAEQLGIGERTLYRKLKRYGLG